MTSPLDRVPELAAWLGGSGLAELELTGPDGRVHLRRGAVEDPERRHAEEQAEPASRSTRDRRGSFETPASRAPQDDAVVDSCVASSFRDDDFETVPSAGVGRFLSTHPLRQEPLVRPDHPVVAGEPIGLLQIDGLLLPVAAPRDGVVARVVAQDGALVGYGEPLVALWKE